MGLLKNHLPCKCTNKACGFEFQAGNLVSGSVVMTGCITLCPRCGSTANIPDGKMSNSGKYEIRDVLNYIGDIKDNSILKSIKTDLEASNDDITPDELVDCLVEIDPSFSKFKETIKLLPVNALGTLTSVIINIITLILLYHTFIASEGNHNENLSLQKEQFEFEQERFEYQKEKDTNEAILRNKNSFDADEIQNQINKLKLDFENRIKELEVKKTSQTTSLKVKKKLKGSLRNKPCLCGSGLKAKKCHPYGYIV